MGWTEAPAVKREPPGGRPLPSPPATAPRLDSTGFPGQRQALLGMLRRAKVS